MIEFSTWDIVRNLLLAARWTIVLSRWVADGLRKDGCPSKGTAEASQGSMYKTDHNGRKQTKSVYHVGTRPSGALTMAATLALLAGLTAYLYLTEPPPPRVVPYIGIMSAMPRAGF